MRLIDMVSFLFSKNAGPFAVTFDVLFKDRESYDLARRSGVFTKDSLAKFLQIPEERFLSVHEYEGAWVIKFTVRREISAGDFGDASVFGSQHWPPLIDLEIPEPAPSDTPTPKESGLAAAA